MAVVNTNLQLIISVCPAANGKTLTLSEATGVFNVQSNPGGWATPATTTNPDPANVTNRQLVITDPNGNTATFNNAQLVTIFPDPTGVNTLVIDSSAFGNPGTNTLPTGTYEATYTIQGTIGGSDTYTERAVARFFNSNELNCCRDLLFHAIGADCDNCKSEKLAVALEVDSYIKAAEYADGCGDTTKAQKFQAKALWLCNTYNCLNCL